MVALPASIESLVMSILGVILNLMLVVTGGAEAVAVYTAGWRVVMMAMIPPIGIGTAAITVGGAAYGARNYKNLSTALSYSAKLGVGIAVVTGLLSYVFAGNIATIFTYSPESAFMATARLATRCAILNSMVSSPTIQYACANCPLRWVRPSI